MDVVKMEQRHHFINLFAVALADNNLEPKEITYLYELGIEKGLSREEIDDIISNPHKARFVKPSTMIEAIDQLFDLIQMVLRDGRIHPHEVDLCKSFAKRFGINKEIIDDLIEKLIEEVQSGKTKQTLIDELKPIL